MMARADVAALCVRADSVYFGIPSVDPWDAARDAAAYLGSGPVICHPPCRSWGRLRRFSNVREGERDLARACVWHVRRNGGVLEHPDASSLWADMDLPRPGRGRDAWGGFSLSVDQYWWGHEARKRTWLYVVGVEPRALPVMPFVMCGAVKPVTAISKADREHTPRAFAEWLIELARASSIAPADRGLTGSGCDGRALGASL